MIALSLSQETRPEPGAPVTGASGSFLAAPHAAVLPHHRDLFYGGAWHASVGGTTAPTINPADGRVLAEVAQASAVDVDRVVAAAQAGFETWRATPPAERAAALREAARVIRAHGDELALLDALDGGNPVAEMDRDALIAAASLDFFAGLVTEMKGDTIPMGPDRINFTVREPVGVVARIVAFNHPFMFCGAKAAAPLAAGNAVIMKPPEQAPLSGLRLAELIGGLFPPGVFNVVTGGREAGAALAAHPGVAMTTLIGSVPTGRRVMTAAAETIKPVLLELGGKNALIVYPDADPVEAARAIVDGMNFTWCGQSCGSTSRAFVHRSLYDAVLERVAAEVARYRPGIPSDRATTMGALVSREQHARVLAYIDYGREDGARLLSGGKAPADPALADGFFVEPTIFCDVTPAMRIATEEIFGPVLSILPWSDRTEMLRQVNGVDFGLTCSIWTNDLHEAHRTAQEVDAGFVWVNEVAKHFLGAPFGGIKQSGIGREECLAELLAFTREKNVHIRVRPR